MKYLALLCLFLLPSCHNTRPVFSPSIVKLEGNLRQCTAFQIEAPSGREYLLTAGHCVALTDDKGSITVELENGDKIQRKLISLSGSTDLLLLEPVPGLRGFNIAQEAYRGEETHILGHGWGLPTWEVDCRLVGNMDILDWNETVCSQEAVPGHSGSPALDPNGQVIGVVSTAGMNITGLVKLSDIQVFLKGY